VSLASFVVVAPAPAPAPAVPVSWSKPLKKEAGFLLKLWGVYLVWLSFIFFYFYLLKRSYLKSRDGRS
jgi:hypothetical protein